MKFDLNKSFSAIALVIFGFAVILISNLSAHAQPTAVVPQQIIYPGQEITFDMVKEVDVLNPNLRPGYAKIIEEVEGFITKKTLLPGRTIPVSALREAYVIERGKNISMVFSNNSMVITAQGVALQNGGLGEVVRARNLDSGVIISGTVMQDGTLRVITQ
ncbi:MAG: flagellar basal body P-ring formation chaperone FlgA [Lentilitoribacter sp.]